MIYREELLSRIKDYLTRLAVSIKMSNAIDDYHINYVCESLFIELLNVIFDTDCFFNLNSDVENYPGVDLADDDLSIAVQVTSSNSGQKINHTLEEFFNKNLDQRWTRLIILIVTDEGQRGGVWKKNKKLIEERGFDFVLKRDVWTLENFAAEIKDLVFKDQVKIRKILKEQVGGVECALMHLSRPLDFEPELLRSVDRERKSEKYIPEIYREDSYTKDNVRFFCDFTRYKGVIDDQLSRLYLSHLINWGKMMEIEALGNVAEGPFASVEEFADAIRPLTPFDIGSIADYSASKIGNYRCFLDQRNKIGYAVNGLLSIYKEMKKAIKCSVSKVMLLHGEAGIGKTNFVCDFIANTIVPQKIPAFFLRAQDLFGLERGLCSVIVNNSNLLKSLFVDDPNVLHNLSCYLESIDKNLIIVIDGVNELRNPKESVAVIRAFVNEIEKMNRIKLFFTCRTQFKEDFLNDFIFEFGEITSVLELKSQYGYKDTSLFDGYAKFYDVECVVSDYILSKLEERPLLLRIFCEAYQGGYKKGEFITNLSKVVIFRRYKEKKLEVAGFTHLEKIEAERVLFSIVDEMIDSDQFGVVEGSSLESGLLPALDKMSQEEIFIRYDNDLDCIGGAYSFTYDEFRDYLISLRVLNKLNRGDWDYFDALKKSKNFPMHAVSIFLFVFCVEKDKGEVKKMLSERGIFESTLIDGLLQLDERFLKRSFSNDLYSFLKVNNSCFFFEKLFDYIFRCPQCGIGQIFIEIKRNSEINDLDFYSCLKDSFLTFIKKVGLYRDLEYDGVALDNYLFGPVQRELLEMVGFK